MFCSGAMADVSECEFAYLDLVIVRAKEKGVPKDSLVVRFGAIRLAALGAVGAMLHLSYLEPKAQSSRRSVPRWEM